MHTYFGVQRDGAFDVASLSLFPYYVLQKNFATLLRLFINNNGDDNGDDPDDNDGYDQDDESIAQVI